MMLEVGSPQTSPHPRNPDQVAAWCHFILTICIFFCFEDVFPFDSFFPSQELGGCGRLVPVGFRAPEIELRGSFLGVSEASEPKS